jgi:hypothetical protein
MSNTTSQKPIGGCIFASADDACDATAAPCGTLIAAESANPAIRIRQTAKT